MITFRKNDDRYLLVLLDAAENTLKGAQLFRTAMMGEKEPQTYNDAIKELENTGDTLTHDIFRQLNSIHIAPLSREDILELAVLIDDIMDGIEATIARFDYLGIHYTNEVMRQFSEILVASCEHVYEAIKLLTNKKFLQIRQHTVQVNALENDGDRLMREGIADIFKNRKDPYHDFALKEIYERLEQTTDACEDVADVLESIVLRYA
ncbi:DUF47 domain-containing protein [Marinicrinis sediminis]|uniref:DUF47 domain-containing protein n=1 Tax=Marinicrinis sediminis TaxID=1652465 RepID=A0ABW5RD49_9BACL